jgi:probable phosphoglycerate mutase
MILLLARHGNTFEPGQTAFWVGRNQDMELTVEGRAQALRAGKALADAGTRPLRIMAAPLKRTMEFGRLVSGRLGGTVPVTADARLTELDYGAWAGLSNDEIEARFGPDELEAWQARGAWPVSAGFAPPEPEIRAGIESLAREQAALCGPSDTVMFVSSNGVLRYFLGLVPGAFESFREKGGFKVKTGNLCAIDMPDDGTPPRIAFWNEPPAG